MMELQYKFTQIFLMNDSVKENNILFSFYPGLSSAARHIFQMGIHPLWN